MTTVVASAAVARDGAFQPGWIAYEDGRIVEADAGPPPAGAIDLGDLVLAPGFIDLQCNGLDDVDFAAADPSGWLRARRVLAAHGVTALCPTFITTALDAYDGMLARAAEAADDAANDAAAILGVHLEGPFLGGAPGAHDSNLIRPVDLEWLDGLLARHPGIVRMVTLAPEADPGLAGTRALVAADVVVALGHTTASIDEVRAAADAGAACVTHLFNGMAPWHHREPGLVGAALTDPRLTPTVIADLVHVHPTALQVAFAATTVATVSDTVGGLFDVRDGAAWLPDGRLAGATTLLDRAVVNLVASGIDPVRALESVTAVPARVLGIEDRGHLGAGAAADLVALDPSTFAVTRVWLGGVEITRDDH